MKILKLTFVIGISITLSNCSITNKVNKVAESMHSKNGKTYAEISVKTDGSWKDRKYIGGTTFNNTSELKLDPHHTDHSFDIRYEGPGWESNKIGYRLYLDWRNAIDIFGKRTEDIVLPNVGQDNFDSYHKMNNWGGDILHNGKSIGIGGIGRYVNNEMLHFNNVASTVAKVENFKDKSVVKIDYTGWETNKQTTNFKSTLTIFPDQRYTRHTIESSMALDGICTGIVLDPKFPNILKSESGKKWAYIATYGAQSLAEPSDNLGLAIFYQTETADQLLDGTVDHLIVFKPTTKPITFYFLGAWEQEINGIKTQDQFIKYLNDQLNILNNTNELK